MYVIITLGELRNKMQCEPVLARNGKRVCMVSSSVWQNSHHAESNTLRCNIDLHIDFIDPKMILSNANGIIWGPLACFGSFLAPFCPHLGSRLAPFLWLWILMLLLGLTDWAET